MAALIIWPILGPIPGALAFFCLGYWMAIPAVVVTLAAYILFLRSFFRFFEHQALLFRDDARERYRRVFRVVALPTDKRNICMPWGNELKVGDYGWEAQPLRKNDLIWLQGLTETWLVVWHAGFRPDEIEYVAPKPSSQYDWRDNVGDPIAAVHMKPCQLRQACPYPVRPRRPYAMGFPSEY
jgi:hypothetical protein